MGSRIVLDLDLPIGADDATRVGDLTAGLDVEVGGIEDDLDLVPSSARSVDLLAADQPDDLRLDLHAGRRGRA